MQNIVVQGSCGAVEVVVQMLDVAQCNCANVAQCGQFVQPAAVSSVPAGGNLGDPEYKVARQRSSSLSFSYMEESEEKDENDDNDGNAGINEEYDVSAL